MLPEARHSVAALTRLRQELSEDRQAMRVRLSEMEDATSRLDDPPWTSHAAVAIHGWYTALESALERVARILDGDVPRGDRWHRELLSQATVEVPGVRPPVLPRELIPDLLELLAFRHFFRHAYGVALDPAKVDRELERAESIAGQIDRALSEVDEYLADAVRVLRSQDD